MNTDEAIHRLTEVIRRTHLALATERSYCAWFRRFSDCLKELPSHLSVAIFFAARAFPGRSGDES